MGTVVASRGVLYAWLHLPLKGLIRLPCLAAAARYPRSAAGGGTRLSVIHTFLSTDASPSQNHQLALFGIAT